VLQTLERSSVAATVAATVEDGGETVTEEGMVEIVDAVAVEVEVEAEVTVVVVAVAAVVEVEVDHHHVVVEVEVDHQFDGVRIEAVAAVEADHHLAVAAHHHVVVEVEVDHHHVVVAAEASHRDVAVEAQVPNKMTNPNRTTLLPTATHLTEVKQRIELGTLHFYSFSFFLKNQFMTLIRYLEF